VFRWREYSIFYNEQENRTVAAAGLEGVMREEEDKNCSLEWISKTLKII
jgi:hypothetical protein